MSESTSIPEEINWKTLFSGNPHDGWMHSGIGIFSDGQIVFESPGGRAFIVLNPEDETFIKVDVDAAILHGVTVVSNSSDDSFWICDPGGTEAVEQSSLPSGISGAE
jgi:hypothetical protein